MLRVQILVNENIIIGDLYAVRIHPKGKKIIENGTKCTYQIMYEKVMVGTTFHPYGDAIGLSIKILQIYKQNEEMVQELNMIEKIGKLNDDKFY